MPKNPSTAARALKHAAHTAWRKVADEAVILDVDTAHYYSLSGPGLRVWELAGAGRSPAQICARLAEEYDAAPERIAADVGELLASLRKEGLLVPA